MRSQQRDELLALSCALEVLVREEDQIQELAVKVESELRTLAAA